MVEKDTHQELHRLFNRARDCWLPEDVDAFRSTFEALADTLEIITVFPLAFEEEPAYPTTIYRSLLRSQKP